VTDLDPVMVGEPLWVLRKDWHSAEARVRAIHNVGLELRFSVDDNLYFSQIFKAWEPLEQLAREKRSEFEAKGWSPVGTDPSTQIEGAWKGE
jgi:hypothetical protein